MADMADLAREDKLVGPTGGRRGEEARKELRGKNDWVERAEQVSVDHPEATYHKVWVRHGPTQNKQTNDSERAKTRTCRPILVVVVVVNTASCAKSLNAASEPSAIRPTAALDQIYVVSMEARRAVRERPMRASTAAHYALPIGAFAYGITFETGHCESPS
uniref:Uncharacterized protein n=1 Tax=Plectus sambesii TaxID=2011161 RepID=A0A914XKN1_9BILA